MKKVVSLLLVVVLALGMTTMAFAAGTKVDYINGNDAATLVDIDLGDVEPGDEYGQSTFDFASLPASVVFMDKNDKVVVAADESATPAKTLAIAANNSFSKSQLSKLTVKSKITKGGNLIEDFGFDFSKNRTQGLKLEFIEPFVSNDPDGKDFEITMYLAAGSKRYDNIGFYVTGTLANPQTDDIDADTDYINLDGGYITECVEYAKSLEYYLGEGVSLFGKAFKNAKYYGYVTKDATEAQANIIDKYDFDEVYNISTVGLKNVCNYISLADADPDSYVYNADLKLVGQAKDNLDYSDVFYLADKKLDIDETDDEYEEEPEEDDGLDGLDDWNTPIAPPITGGEDDLDNVNYNPSTGK